MADKTEVKCEIKEEYGVLSTSTTGWKKEINLVSWNGAAPKFDIRDWAPEHERSAKGVTLTREEAENLYKILGGILEA